MTLHKIFNISMIFLGVSVSAQKVWSLQECVDYASKNNLQVLQNNYNKLLQDKNLASAKKEYLPGVNASISNTLGFGQGSIANTSYRNDNFNNNVNVGANILVYNNGRLEKNIRKAGYDVEAAQYDIETIKNNISLQIAQQYLNILLNKEIIKISESAVANAQKLYDRAKITTEVGTTAQTILAEADASLAREKQNLKTAQINADRSRFALAILLQLSDYKDFDVEGIPGQYNPQAPDFSAEQVLNTAYAGQPQIKAAESRVKSSEAQTEVTKTAFWPTVSASAGVGSFYNNMLSKNPDGSSSIDPTFFKQYKDNFGQQVGISANIPIFNKGITKLQVEQSKINEDLAKNNLELQKQDIKQNIQKAAFDADSNYEAYLAALQSEKSSKLALEFAEKSYEAGKTSIYDLNIARNNLANAQGTVSQAKFNYLFSQKLLDFYSGLPLTL